MVSFKVTKAERAIIVKIVDRGIRMAEELGNPVEEDRQSVEMDITACHANGNPLRLQEFLDADDFNFAHDFFGIRNCIDRNNGKMTRHFLPRFTCRRAVTA